MLNKTGKLQITDNRQQKSKNETNHKHYIDDSSCCIPNE